MAKLVCSAKAKPNKYYRVAPPQYASFLKDKPIRDIPGIGSKTLRSLADLGISKESVCAHFWDIPLKVLKKRLGNNKGQVLFDISRGVDTSKWTPVMKPQEAFSVQASFGVRTNSEQDVKDLLRTQVKMVRWNGSIWFVFTFRLLFSSIHLLEYLAYPQYLSILHYYVNT